MSYYLMRDGQCLNVSIFAWPQILRAAQAYGWKPAGLAGEDGQLPPEPLQEPEPGSGPLIDAYLTNPSGWVGDQDAGSIATALQAALADLELSDYEFYEVLRTERGLDQSQIDYLVKVRRAFSEIVEKDPTAVTSFVEFSQAGGFAIA